MFMYVRNSTIQDGRNPARYFRFSRRFKFGLAMNFIQIIGNVVAKFYNTRELAKVTVKG